MQGAERGAWFKQAMVVAGYALGYWLLQQVLFPYWVLFAGFRLATLIFVPTRYWAALAVGELIPLGYLAASCGSQYGWSWAALTAFPTPIVLAMPLVHGCKNRLRMLPVRGGVRMGVLLLLMLSVASLWTVMNTGRMAVTRLPVNYQFDYVTLMARWFIGNFLGTLTVVPLAVWLRDSWRAVSPGQRWRRFADSRLLLETVSLLMPALGLLLWIVSHAETESSREAARMAMFLPVVFLALRHGWQGAAVGGTLASVTEVLTMSGMNDIGAIQAEVFIAFTITSMLLMGARISVLNQRDAQERIDVVDALALARRNIDLGEARLQLAAQFLENIRDLIGRGYEQMLAQLRHVPSVDHRLLTRQSARVQEELFHLSEGLYPAGGREKDLIIALRQGPLARALDGGGVHYWCEASGDFSSLSPALRLAAYRLVGECVALVCQDLPPTHIRVRLRAGLHGGRPWVGMRLRAWTDVDRMAAIRLDDVRLRLASAGLSGLAAEDRARSYQGRLRQVTSMHRRMITVVLPDLQFAPEEARDPVAWITGQRVTAGAN